MAINWGALGVVAAVSLVIGMLVLVLVSLAMVALSSREPDQPGEPADEAPVILHTGSGRPPPAAGTVIAAVCLLGAATSSSTGSTFSPTDRNADRNAAPGTSERHTTGAAGRGRGVGDELAGAPLMAR